MTAVTKVRSAAIPTGRSARVYRIDGRMFRSGFEAVTYLLGKELTRLGVLVAVLPPTRWHLYVRSASGSKIAVKTVGGRQEMTYQNDHNFVWPDGTVVHIDCKGWSEKNALAFYNLKKQLVEAEYGVTIETWRPADVRSLAKKHGVDLKKIARENNINW